MPALYHKVTNDLKKLSVQIENAPESAGKEALTQMQSVFEAARSMGKPEQK